MPTFLKIYIKRSKRLYLSAHSTHMPTSKYLSAHSTHAHINVFISTFYSCPHQCIYQHILLICPHQSIYPRDILISHIIIIIPAAVVIIWQLDLQLPMQSVLPITIKIVSSNPTHGEVYLMQHYVIKVDGVQRQVGGFLMVLWSPPPIILTATI